MARTRSTILLPQDSPEPISVINTTPLIDLMLVLLIMFILSVPVATHKVPLELPRGVPPPEREEPAFHRLDIDAAGRIFWDGRMMTDVQLRTRLAALAADPAEPELHLSADSATRYERVDQLLALIRRAGVERLGFVGNERFAEALDR